MTLFFLGIILLAVGYMTYGRFIEKMIAPDDRQTPAVAKYDGVDYVCLPHWKNMLIQLLNIAGVGPVIGVILGIKFGTIVFVVIPIGNVIAGATHDFLSGMMSMRHGGANLPALVRMNLGNKFYGIFSVFMMLLLLLVVAVFVNIPAQIIDSMMPEVPIFWFAVIAIFFYYICSTIFPIDKIIGKIYPLFGALLLVGTLAICVAVIAYAKRASGDTALVRDDCLRHNFRVPRDSIAYYSAHDEVRAPGQVCLLRNDDSRGGNCDDMGRRRPCYIQSLS